MASPVTLRQWFDRAKDFMSPEARNLISTSREILRVAEKACRKMDPNNSQLKATGLPYRTLLGNIIDGQRLVNGRPADIELRTIQAIVSIDPLREAVELELQSLLSEQIEGVSASVVRGGEMATVTSYDEPRRVPPQAMTLAEVVSALRKPGIIGHPLANKFLRILRKQLLPMLPVSGIESELKVNWILSLNPQKPDPTVYRDPREVLLIVLDEISKSRGTETAMGRLCDNVERILPKVRDEAVAEFASLNPPRRS